MLNGKFVIDDPKNIYVKFYLKKSLNAEIMKYVEIKL